MISLKPNDFFDDRYKLIQRLGTGGYSEVWCAEDIKSGNMQVALKIFAPGSGLDTDGLKLFSNEYSLVFNLNHPHLLKPTYFDDFEGMPYLVFQYMSKGNCLKLCGNTTEHQLAEFMIQVGGAVQYLHEQNPPVIHQDIKPANILMDGKGNYVLTDFGISTKIRKTLTKSMGQHSLSSGTTAYMAPERFGQNLSDRTPIFANDLFSLGVTLFELLTDELPYGEMGGMVANTGNKPALLPDSFNENLRLLIAACLEKDTWRRPSAAEIVDSAKAFVETGKWKLPERIAPAQKTTPIHPPLPPKAEPPIQELPKTQPIVENLHSQSNSAQQKTAPMPQHQNEQKLDKKSPKKKSAWPYIVFASAGLLVLILLIYRSSMNDKNGPEAIAEQFLQHLNKKEYTEAKKLGTEATQQMIGFLESFPSDEPVEELRIEDMDCVLDYDIAKCTYKENGKDATINLVKQGSAWLVDMPKEMPEEDDTLNEVDVVTDTIAAVTHQNESSSFTFDYPMVYVQGGTFTMGCTNEQSNCFDDEYPAHEVTLSGYSIGKYEVTQKQWRSVMGDNPSSFSGCDNCPVEKVSWNDVQDFIRKLNQKTGKSYRLPTEAEWEFAARGGNKSRGYQYSGSNSIGSVAWYSDNSNSKTHPVGQKSPNELGLYDMSGNVYEWCSDWYGDYGGYPQTNPIGSSTGSRRVIRGGSWINLALNCRAAHRFLNTPDIRDDFLGFRLVLP